MKYCWVSLNRSLHLFMPSNLNTPLLLFSDLGACFVIETFPGHYCNLRNASLYRFGHIQRQAHVGLFKLYLIFLPCNNCRHVENLHDISCCFWQWNYTITSSIYKFIAFSKVIKACFVQSHCCISGNSAAKIPALRTLLYSISRTVPTNSSFHYGDFTLRATINLLPSSPSTSVVCSMVKWPLFTSIWIYWNPTSCCWLFLLLPGLRWIFKRVSWVICIVDVMAVLRWTNCFLRRCCVPRITILGVAPGNLPVFDLLSPARAGCVSLMC